MGLKYLKDVATLKLTQEKCTGCGMCEQVCPHGVFLMENHKAQMVNKDNCMECGACARNCAFEAIEVQSGVGCACAIIMGWIMGTEPNCDCSGNSGGCC